MISTKRSWTAATKTSAAVAASLLAVGVAACGGVTGGSTDAAGTGTVTMSQSTPGGTGGGSTAARDQAAIPEYQPGSVVSKSKYSTVLKSPDSISKIGSFYRDALARGGWRLRSSSSSAYHASFSAHRANEGVSISVYPRLSGSGISVSEHPE